MASSNSFDSEGPIAAINVTPLVDVMLVLLIIFMITAPMMQQGVDVELPKASSGAMKGKDEPLVLSIDKGGDIYITKDSKLTLEDVGVKVAAIITARGEGERKVFIKADTGLPYGQIMAVMGRLHEAGVTEIGLVSQPPEASPS
jgi:biopolymer transport protein TolR